jgi:tyrosine-protein kinase Etk/Wzc
LPRKTTTRALALGEIIAVLMDYRWLIAAICLMALLLGLVWVFASKPVYRADGLLQVEEKELRYGLAEGSATAAG